jgi:hypothetical protein
MSIVNLAKESALQVCGNGCSIFFVYGNGNCAAVARTNSRFGAAARGTLDEAEFAALSECSKHGTGCKVILSGCNGNVTIPRDINKDCTVDMADYNILRTNYNQTDCGNPADLNGDCIVNGLDYSILHENYGKSCTD